MNIYELVFSPLFLKGIINLTSITFLVIFIYFKKYKNQDFVFNFILFNLVSFFVSSLLANVEIKVGFAFGLFAMFSVIRYRTVQISVKNMGYLFVCVALGMVNALSFTDQIYEVLLFINILILVVAYVLESNKSFNPEVSTDILYDRIDLIKPSLKGEMLKDLSSRTELPIHRVEILSIDYLKDVSQIKVFYYAENL